MQTAIDQVVASDESARDAVAEARARAEALLEQAGKEAAAVVETSRRRIAQLEKTEIGPIISTAEEEAKQTLDRAEQYIQRLRATVAERQDRILDEFLAAVLPPGRPAG